MSLEDLGNIGEFVAAVAVVISLIYLAVQIRQNTSQIVQNTHAVKVASADSHLQYGVQFRGQIIESADVARVWRTGMEAVESLNEDDRLRFFLLMMNAFASMENRFLHAQEGIVPGERWNAWRNALQLYLSEPGPREWWISRKSLFTPGFIEEVESVISEVTHRTEAAAESQST